MVVLICKHENIPDVFVRICELESFVCVFYCVVYKCVLLFVVNLN